MFADLDKFVHDQLSVWPDAARNFRALKSTRTRQLPVGGIMTTLQFNPLRMASCTADTDESALSARPCFLCAENRPPMQHGIKFEGRKGRKYDILINFFPIFPGHLLIGSVDHTPQSIWHRYPDMLDMAKQMDDYVIYYNGPAAGASAPDHMHFQACPKGYLPMERDIDRLLRAISPEEGIVPEAIAGDIEYISSVRDAQLFHYKHFTRGVFALRARTSKSMAKQFYRLLDSADFPEGEKEPRFNCYTWFSEGEYRSFMVFRTDIRPKRYYAEGPERFIISPGAAEMAGYIITPREEDFERVDSDILSEIMADVSLSEKDEKQLLWRLVRKQPKIEVGIMSGQEICFEIISDGAGPQTVRYREGKIDYNGALYDELFFEAKTISTLFEEPSFILYGVTIGVDFHWERKENQRFAGTLKFIVENGGVTAVNVIGVEDYLLSVISSEMKSTAPLEFLKAHAVISRSWVMAQTSRRRSKATGVLPFRPEGLPGLVTWLENTRQAPESSDGPERIIKWYDHEDHKRFDVCADDHCQRYQGLGHTVSENAKKAIDETWGQILMSEGEIADARFSKCCGGAMEKFSTCWEDRDFPYLTGKRDASDETLPDLTVEGNAREWILSKPDSYCNTSDKIILGNVLNDYDLETPDFFRWEERVPLEVMSERISRKSGRQIGTLKELIPLERGVSGRIKLLRIVGSKDTIEIGKELTIRKILSEFHLKSSAFVAEITDTEVILKGAGWGHGAGLCQIGAAVMASEGSCYRSILSHYYPGTTLEIPFS